MEKIKLKTTINCGGCVASVKPFLDKMVGIGKWEVDINDPNKILTVTSLTLTVDDIKDILEKAGFKGEEIK